MKSFRSEIDIILPNYNSEKFIQQTVYSIKNQSFKKWKLFIIDDNSNSKTKTILKSFKKDKRIKVIWLSKNKGAAYCRNLAIKKSSSKYIAFIDSDDIWAKKKLEYQLIFMKKFKYDFTYTFYETFGLKNKKIITPERYNFSSFINDTSIATSTVMVTRKVAQNVKFTNTKICEDFFYKCQILKKVGNAFCVTKFLTKYRVRHNSLQSNKVRNLFWVWKINRNYNKLNFFSSLFSIIAISFNSFKKYGFK